VSAGRCNELWNKQQGFLQYGVMKKLFKFMPVHSPVLMMALLRLLHNLSFDSKVREDMVAIGFIPKLCEIMQSRRYVPFSLLLSALANVRHSWHITAICFGMKSCKLCLHLKEP
jgi:hypothetical protein